MIISPINPLSDYANYSALAKNVPYRAEYVNYEWVPVVCGKYYPSKATQTRRASITVARQHALAIVTSYQKTGVRARAVLVEK